MTSREALKKLESLGTAQNRKVYARHGIGPHMFGVSFANLNTLRKQIGTDHALAQELWATGNHDAQVLAAMIADPRLATDRMLESWVAGLSNYVVTGTFADFVSKTSFARAKLERWTKSDHEWIGRAGWVILARVAMDEANLPDVWFEKYLGTIERDIHNRKNRVRDAMNSALIAIGIRNRALHAKAIAAAKKIGTVTVDHGETNCKTPDAMAYMANSWARKRRSIHSC